jgi:hypothetical protein
VPFVIELPGADWSSFAVRLLLNFHSLDERRNLTTRYIKGRYNIQANACHTSILKGLFFLCSTADLSTIFPDTYTIW